MTNEPDLRPATTAEITTALAFALQYQGRKLAHDADDFMARVAAERLVKHLEASGFVVMKRPPAPHHTTSGMAVVRQPEERDAPVAKSAPGCHG